MYMHSYSVSFSHSPLLSISRGHQHIPRPIDHVTKIIIGRWTYTHHSPKVQCLGVLILLHSPFLCLSTSWYYLKGRNHRMVHHSRPCNLQRCNNNHEDSRMGHDYSNYTAYTSSRFLPSYFTLLYLVTNIDNILLRIFYIYNVYRNRLEYHHMPVGSSSGRGSHLPYDALHQDTLLPLPSTRQASRV